MPSITVRGKIPALFRTNRTAPVLARVLLVCMAVLSNTQGFNMAYISSENLRTGMVVAHNLLDQNRKVLLQAGVALGKSHIQALRSLGIKGLEIRGNSHQQLPVPHAIGTAHNSRHKNREEGIPAARKQSATTTSSTGKPVLETLRVTRAAPPLLQPALDPLVARQTKTILNELLKGTAIKKDSAVAAVIRLCAIRILHAKTVKKQTPV